MAEGRFLVIVPTYNEIDSLPRKIPLILEQDSRLDVLVVDDASPDGTGALADDLAAGDERVHVLHRPGKAGLGPAYLAGFDWGLEREYDLLFEMDADISHPPEALPKMIGLAKDHDVVIGSRYVEGRVTVSNWPMSRLLVSYFGSWYARIITGMPVRDATGGFNGWHRNVLETVAFDQVRSNGYAFQIELKYLPERLLAGGDPDPVHGTGLRGVQDVEEDRQGGRMAGLVAPHHGDLRTNLTTGDEA
jgi:dolichol-phosphate mannosyltransferase